MEQKPRKITLTKPQTIRGENVILRLAAPADRDDQVAFTVETMAGKTVGAIRLHDPRDRSFSWDHSLTADAPEGAEREAIVLLYTYALSLGFICAHIEAEAINKKLCEMHEADGAGLVAEKGGKRFYTLNRTDLSNVITSYQNRLPEGITIGRAA